MSEEKLKCMGLKNHRVLIDNHDVTSFSLDFKCLDKLFNHLSKVEVSVKVLNC